MLQSIAEVPYDEGVSRSHAWSTLLSLAEEQWGLLTTQQFEAAGMAWSTLSRTVKAGTLERVAHGVYRVRGAGAVEFLDLRAAWLQLAPAVPGWERGSGDGVVSHRSGAALFGIGPLPADVHEFTLPQRRQTRRRDVRLHRGHIEGHWMTFGGLPITKPHRIASDLLGEREDPGAVGQVIADALRLGLDTPDEMARALTSRAKGHGLREGDGVGLLRWLLEVADYPETDPWVQATPSAPAAAAR